MIYRALTRFYQSKALYSSLSTNSRPQVGYIVGAYESSQGNVLTPEANKINTQCSGSLSHQLNYGGLLKEGKSRVLFGLSETFPIVSVVGLGKKDQESDPLEERDEKKERVRTAVAAGCRSLKEFELEKILVDSCGDSSSAAEGSRLSLFAYRDLKSEQKKIPSLHPLIDDDKEWAEGSVMAEGQNIARKLMEMPSNILTPSHFAQEATNYLEHLGVEVKVRTEAWAKERKMNAFLCVAQGSSQPPIFLELNYKGGNGTNGCPLAIVGKGITFDSGGISLKPSAKMEAMRGDMGGAACTVGSIYAAAALRLPINIKGFIPLCENMPGGNAIKPGDVIVASNGKSIQIDNTDAEGRLILADALHYACQHNPKVLLDMATLTGHMAIALGAGATGVFSSSSSQWGLLQKSAYTSGDRVWRMPMWRLYEDQVKDFGMADVHNLGKYKVAGASLAAVFLKQFVTCDQWMHLDIAGVMENSDEVPHLGKGMSGRPTRTVATYASLLSRQS